MTRHEIVAANGSPELGAALEALRLAAAPRASAPGVGQNSLAEG